MRIDNRDRQFLISKDVGMVIVSRPWNDGPDVVLRITAHHWGTARIAILSALIVVVD